MPKKSCSPCGRWPVKSAANQPMIAVKKTPIDHSPSQMRSGIASRSRKKTVRRERSRSSVTMSCTGWSATGRSLRCARDGTDPRRRAAGGGADPGPRPPHAHLQLEHPRGADVPEGGAVPEDWLVQGARRPQQALVADAGGKGARRDRDLRREPRAGTRLGRGARADRLPRRHVREREPGEGGGDARLRRLRRPRGGRCRRGVRAARRAHPRDGSDARASVRRPARDGGPGNARARAARGRARGRDDRRADRRRRARRRGSRRRRRTGA